MNFRSFRLTSFFRLFFWFSRFRAESFEKKYNFDPLKYRLWVIRYFKTNMRGLQRSEHHFARQKKNRRKLTRYSILDKIFIFIPPPVNTSHLFCSERKRLRRDTDNTFYWIIILLFYRFQRSVARVFLSRSNRTSGVLKKKKNKIVSNVDYIV